MPSRRASAGLCSAKQAGRLERSLRHAPYLRPGLTGGEPIIILVDDLASPTPAPHDWLLHSLEQMQVDEQGETITTRRNAARLQVQFLTPQGLKFGQTNQFTVKPEAENMPNQWHLTAQTAAPATTGRFVTIMKPYREGQEEGLAQARLIDRPGWVVVELASPEGRSVVAIRTDAKPGATTDSGGTRVSGDVFAASWDKVGAARGVFQRNGE